jgi:hypothetical protein
MRLNNWSIAASYDTARIFAGLRLRLLHREQIDDLATAPHRRTSEHANNGDFP